MSLTMIKILLLVACFGHVLCCFCDRAITYTPNGRFHFGDLNDNAKINNCRFNSSFLDFFFYGLRLEEKRRL